LIGISYCFPVRLSVMVSESRAARGFRSGAVAVVGLVGFNGKALTPSPCQTGGRAKEPSIYTNSCAERESFPSEFRRVAWRSRV